ncbi:genomic island protein [Entomomonas sp. E2T0]|uniref:portal protein n=1 Tax=Entomomonas sp. E2T0 TaxID=2930213 RepID=UPI00222828CA|nr:portal protein [Entomomonas sp. E2T0]UYZ85320.1 genomic island protein [Entomomonas sp. E2T0]
MIVNEELDIKETDDTQLCAMNWQRYNYGMRKGHSDYCQEAKENEAFYLGKQWSDAALAVMQRLKKPALTINQILPRINAAIGYQIANRADISYRPRGGVANDELAATLSKLAMQIADNINFHWKETELFADGLIMKRGYYDIGISYDDTILGEISINILDPLDVIPDPDANDYDPDNWQDVIVTRWFTIDEIASTYDINPSSLKTLLEAQEPSNNFGDGLDEEETRNSFAGSYSSSARLCSDGIKRYRIIDRQYWVNEQVDVFITPTGDIRIAHALKEEQKNHLIASGYFLHKMQRRVVRRVATTSNAVLYNEISPYNHFTIIPYFPMFRRGLTLGLVDNAKDPQKLLNKTLSQSLHIVNTTANSGFVSWENTLANMSNEKLSEVGSTIGLNLILKHDTDPSKVPFKLQPNPIPSGVTNLTDRATVAIHDVTGINEAMLGQQGQEISGVAIQSRQFAAQQQLALALDSLARTRNMVGRFFIELIQTFYDLPRTRRITNTDINGKQTSEEIYLNYPLEDGRILNDLTIGEYDVVISEQPMQITFDNSQFNQLIELANKVPQVVTPEFIRILIRYSNITDKQDMLDALTKMQEPQTDPVEEAKAQEIMAKIEKLQAEAERIKADSVNKGIESVYSGVQAANVIAATPQTAPIADQLLKSAGYQDKDQPPIVATPTQQLPEAELANPTNTNPLTPANPDVGIMQGIRTPQID